ncbi:MAG TPA: hypothetical protein VIZ30_07205 [Pseudomonadales bacterium]
MTTQDTSRTQLRAQIDAAEERLAVKRSRLRADARAVAKKVPGRLVAPASLAGGVAVGVIMEQASRHRPWSLATMLQGISVANRFAATLIALMKTRNES